MTTDNQPVPANEPATFPPTPKQTPTVPGLPEKEGDEKVDQIADRLAHKGAQREQEFDKENNNLISK
jgi:hypothetical protein